MVECESYHHSSQGRTHHDRHSFPLRVDPPPRWPFEPQASTVVGVHSSALLRTLVASARLISVPDPKPTGGRGGGIDGVRGKREYDRECLVMGNARAPVQLFVLVCPRQKEHARRPWRQRSTRTADGVRNRQGSYSAK